MRWSIITEVECRLSQPGSQVLGEGIPAELAPIRHDWLQGVAVKADTATSSDLTWHTVTGWISRPQFAPSWLAVQEKDIPATLF